MRKHLKLLFLSVVIISGLFVFVSPLLFFAANATYVEGHVTLDTVWTLTDSPFVLSKDVIIDPNVTLTIMPGVEVRFGGNFSLIVKGKLVADGTQDNWITYTSNKESPEAGDWDTIQFIIDGTQQSTLTYCSIEYAINGTTIQNGNVKIANSKIRYNAMNAISIESGYVGAMNNEISNNGNGVYVTGDSQVAIKENTIKSNQDGIFLAGNLTSGVYINQNKVLLNNQSGIHLDIDAYADLSILYNTLSANGKGFHVSGRANTYITNNSIAYNKMGTFYESDNATAHVARHNDIYGNDYGMDASLQATVAATYNYWGNSSGPYHESLNPAGKGNTVGGDGINLDFIPFLTAPIGYINQRPVARLLADKNLVLPTDPVTFIATTSSDDGRVDQYFFDFGDGKNSGWTTLSVFVYTYILDGNHSASVMVMDDFGATSNTEIVEIRVKTGLTPLGTSLTLSHSSTSSESQVSITVSAAEGASIELMSDRGGSFEPSSGFTNSTGHFTATFIAPNVIQKTYFRITATASKDGCADGSDYKYLLVLPLLDVEVTADPVTIKSEATSKVTVHVTHNLNPISNATVTLSSESGGSFNPTTGTTNSNGSVTFTFKAPTVMAQLNVTITATATKGNYFEGKEQTRITLNPRILVVEVTANPATVESQASSEIIVYVAEDSIPVEGVNVTVSSDIAGGFSATNGTTNANGDFKFIFTAPQTTTPVNLTISATTTKSGYKGGEGQTQIVVNPPPSAGPSGALGLPLTTILMIAIPIAVAVIVAVLIKMKVLVISREEA